MFRTGDFFEAFVGGFGPEERLWISIVVVQVVMDSALKFGDAVEGAAADAVSRDLSEEALNYVEPGGRGGGKVQVEAGMGF